MPDDGKVIEFGRYRPLWNVIRAEWDDDWDDLKKMQAIITGGDNPSHIKACIDCDVLSVRTVLNRINEFIASSEPPPAYAFNGINFDLDSVKIPLKRSVAAIDSLLPITPELATKNAEKLLLLMFELGTHVGAINNQDLILKGVESIKKVHRGGHKNGQDKKVLGERRKEAYVCAMKAAQQSGYKPTVNGLRNYLKSLGNNKFETGINECAEIWIGANGFNDSLGGYSESSIQKIKIN